MKWAGPHDEQGDDHLHHPGRELVEVVGYQDLLPGLLPTPRRHRQ